MSIEYAVQMQTEYGWSFCALNDRTTKRFTPNIVQPYMFGDWVYFPMADMPRMKKFPQRNRRGSKQKKGK